MSQFQKRRLMEDRAAELRRRIQSKEKQSKQLPVEEAFLRKSIAVDRAELERIEQELKR